MSAETTMQGYDLLKKLVSATGLPAEGAQQELEKLVGQSGVDLAQVNLDQLRVILANYLQDILLANSQDHLELAD